MHHDPLKAVLMLILVLFLCSPTRAQQGPYTEEQVRDMVHRGLGNQAGARLIALHGLDFSPSDDFIQSLASAGADQAFLEALEVARRLQTPEGGVKRPLTQSPTPGGGGKSPLTQVQIISLVAGEVPNQRVAILVRERGIDFNPTNEYLRELRLAGGDDELEGALKGTHVTMPERVEPAVMAQQTEARRHMAHAAELLRNKQYAEAEDEYRAAIRRDPQDADLHIGLGMVLGRKGDWDGQIAEDREALRLNPNNDRAHLSLGSALARKGNQGGATEEYREAIRLNPNNEAAHISLGIRLSQMGDWDGAIAEYSEALRLYPNGYAVHYSLGMAYEHKGNRQAALQEYRTAYELNPNIPTYKQAYDRLSSQ